MTSYFGDFGIVEPRIYYNKKRVIDVMIIFVLVGTSRYVIVYCDEFRLPLWFQIFHNNEELSEIEKTTFNDCGFYASLVCAI